MFAVGIDVSNGRSTVAVLQSKSTVTLLLYICPSFLAASQRPGTSRCLSCTMWRQWSGAHLQELLARKKVSQPTFH